MPLRWLGKILTSSLKNTWKYKDFHGPPIFGDFWCYSCGWGEGGGPHPPRSNLPKTGRSTGMIGMWNSHFQSPPGWFLLASLASGVGTNYKPLIFPGREKERSWHDMSSETWRGWLVKIRTDRVVLSKKYWKIVSYEILQIMIIVGQFCDLRTSVM